MTTHKNTKPAKATRRAPPCKTLRAIADDVRILRCALAPEAAAIDGVDMVVRHLARLEGRIRLVTSELTSR